MSDSDENEDEPNVENDINERISNFGRTFCASEYDDENCSEDGDDLDGNGDSDIDALRDKVKNACTCKSENCLKDIAFSEIRDSVLTTNELSRDERDMYIMGKLSCVGHGLKTQRGKERKRKRYAYYFRGSQICKGAFQLLYGVSAKYVKNMIAHMNENGSVPRVHRNTNRRPSNAFSFDELKRAVDFISNYADENGLPQPAVRGKSAPITFLPSSGSKVGLHQKYVRSCEETADRYLGFTTFKLLWKECCPHIKYMSPRTDLCPKCEGHRDVISKAVTVDDKQQALQSFTEHLTLVQKERQVYILNDLYFLSSKVHENDYAGTFNCQI